MWLRTTNGLPGMDPAVSDQPDGRQVVERKHRAVRQERPVVSLATGRTSTGAARGNGKSGTNIAFLSASSDHILRFGVHVLEPAPVHFFWASDS